MVNLKIASHKSQAKISTEQSAHSMCPLRSSVCLTRGLQFGIANWKILADCHYSISEGILDRKKDIFSRLRILYLKFGGFILSWCTIFLLCHVSVAKRWNEFPLPMAGLLMTTHLYLTAPVHHLVDRECCPMNDSWVMSLFITMIFEVVVINKTCNQACSIAHWVCP